MNTTCYYWFYLFRSSCVSVSCAFLSEAKQPSLDQREQDPGLIQNWSECLPCIMTATAAARGSCSCSSSSWCRRPTRGAKSRPEWRGSWEPSPGPWASGSGPDPFPGLRAEPSEAAPLRRLAWESNSDRCNGKVSVKKFPGLCYRGTELFGLLLDEKAA